MTSKIKVAVCGAMGKMGREAVRTIIGDEELQLTGGVDVRGVGLDLGVLVGSPPLGVTISSDLEGLLEPWPGKTRWGDSLLPILL